MFEVEHLDIESFDGLQLVKLLRALLYAEARKAGVPLRHVDVPLQITIADGGQDASVRWQDGESKTDYFPSRDVVFQCKASDHGDAKWTSEVWTKKSQPKKVATKVLNPAIAGALTRGACYIGITTTALVGTKAADRADAIRKGIRDAGGDPANLAAIEVYDGNKLVEWANEHPAVALWIKEQKAGMPLAGFSTLEQWGRRAEVAKPPFVGSSEREFSLGPGRANTLDFDQLAGRVVDHLSDPGACIRIWGASGIGKTRALHQALSTSTGALLGIASANFIFCDYRDVPTKIWDVANQIKNAGSAAALIVDNCPWEEALQLNALARAEGSRLRVVTLGAEGRDQMTDCLAIRPKPADLPTIRGILAGGLATAKLDEIDYVAGLCDGFPRVAVLMASSYSRNRGILKSADDMGEQIVKASNIDRETVRALEVASLFEFLDPDTVPNEFDTLAEALGNMPGGLMFEHLVRASEQHLVGRNSDRITVPPRPIADFLAKRRLSYLRQSTVINFLLNAPHSQRDAMLFRWRALAGSRDLTAIVRSLLGGPFSQTEVLLAESTAPYLTPLAHVDADATGSALYFAIIRMPLDDLAQISITDGLLDALRLIASRKSSFKPAAEMVLHLAAASNRIGEGPVLDLLRQLFQVAVAGTEADDRRRREALADALEQEDPRIQRACVEALAAMLRTYLTRSTDFEQVGAEPYRAEWMPGDHETIQGYFRWALERLLDLWRGAPDLRRTIEDLVASELRNLLSPELLPTIAHFVRDVVASEGHWFEATKSIGDWLYFDRSESPTDFAGDVRGLYDSTLPSEPVEQILLYSRFWVADLHDPDTRYAETVGNPDFEYSARRVRELAPAIARDPAQLARVISAMSSSEMNGAYSFAHALALELADPVDAFGQAVVGLDASGTRFGVPFVRALLGALDRRFAADTEITDRLIGLAESSIVFSSSAMNILASIRVTDERLDRLTALIDAGTVTPFEVVPISYGRGLADISKAALRRFIEALVGRREGGAWAALDVLSMYTHDIPALDPALTDLVKLSLLAPGIADGAGSDSANADYVYDRMLRMLAGCGGIDDDFARSFALQIERSCRSVGTRHGRPANALRTALAVVVKHSPQEVWATLAGFYEVATRVERERLNPIVAATKPFAWDVSRIGPGALFETPHALMLDWVEADPDARVAFLVSFFPILERREHGWFWHPALQKLATKFGTSKQFRAALRNRIFPSSWGGSLNAHLTSFKEPLAAWAEDAQLGDWASSTLEAVNRSLADRFYGNGDD